MKKGNRLIITLPEDVTRRYFEIARAKTEAEVNESIEPGGVTLTIYIEPPFGNTASVDGNEIGDVDIELVE